MTQNVGWRFLAAGALLAIMAAWINTNHDPAPTNIVYAVAAAAGLSFLWGLFRLMRASDPTAIRNSPFVGIVIALIAGVCGIWLAMQTGRAGLGESLGLGYFAILLLAAQVGDVTSRRPGAGIEFLQSIRPMAGIAFALAGAVALGTFFYVTLILRAGQPYVPELVGAVLGGFMLLFGGLFLFISSDPPLSASALRNCLIIVGSALGMVLMLVALARFYLWYTEIFAGVSAWTGPDAYKFWYVAYLFLAGVGLTGGSMNLALSEIRESPDLRGILFTFRNIAIIALVGLLLIIVNVFVSMWAPYTYNWSATRGLSELNPATKQLLGSLTEPTKLIVLMSTQDQPFYNEIKNFAGNCQAYTNKISVETVDPDTDPAKYIKLASIFKELAENRGPFDDGGRGVLIVYGPMPEDAKSPLPPHMFIPDKRLYEVDQKGGNRNATLIIKAESEIVKELAFLAKKSERRKIYILQGDGALDIANDEVVSRRNSSFEMSTLGAGKLVDKLKKDNYDVKAISFGVPAPDLKDGKKDKADITFLGSIAGDKKIEIPDDCQTLLVLGPSSPIPPKGLDALERYMDRGGKMIATLDVVTDREFTSLRQSGLSEFLKKYGVNITDQILYRLPQPSDQGFFGPRAVMDYRLVMAESPAKPATMLAKQFLGSRFLWWSPRVVKSNNSAKYQVEPLLVVQPRRSIVVADNDLGGLVNFERYALEIQRSGRLKQLYSPDAIPVAATVTEGTGESAKPRMVVFGDTEFVSNEDLTVYAENYDLIASSIEWMAERGFIGPRPKETSTYSFGPNVNLGAAQGGATWTMLVLLVAFGVAVWLMRRR